MALILVPISADIYSRAPDKGIQYIENAEAIESELRDYQPAQMVFLFDVLEHTASFVNLFEIALDLASERVFVSLPNETNLRVAMGIFFDWPPVPPACACLISSLGIATNG